MMMNTNEIETLRAKAATLLDETGWTVDDAMECAIEAVIESHRYATPADRVLARYEDVPELLPSYDELKARGVDVVKLARCLEAGMDPAEFSQTLGTQSVETVNWALHTLVRQVEDVLVNS